MMPRTHVLVLLLAAVMMLAVGCGGGLVPVAGKVTINGQPAGNLQVTFEPKNPDAGTTGTGFTKPDGTYVLHYPGNKTGAPAGEYVVRITATETDAPAAKPLRIPAKYNTNSELQAKVEAGKSQFDFQLTVP